MNIANKLLKQLAHNASKQSWHRRAARDRATSKPSGTVFLPSAAREHESEIND
jgi:hypothetical protein